MPKQDSVTHGGKYSRRRAPGFSLTPSGPCASPPPRLCNLKSAISNYHQVSRSMGRRPCAGMGYFTPHVVMRNLTGTPQTAIVMLEYPNGPG
ncbi:MAG: hypothetical protein WB763_09355 [Terriglobia bacterium]|jgi:hypothetical protein